ncbi:hypothetical protein AAG906_027334 [Vitis piasezkii]
MGSETALPKWASEPCMMGIDEAGRGPVLDSKTLKEEKREELFENLKADESIGWAVDVIDPRELSAKMLKKLVYVDTVGDAEKYRLKLSERFPAVKFVVAKKADSLYPVVSGASIVAKVTRDRALRDWVLVETAENMHRNFGSGYPGDPETKSWLQHHKHSVFGFPTLVRFSWATCTAYSKDIVEEADKVDEDGSTNRNGKRQLKLSSVGFIESKRKSEEIESSGEGRCKFFRLVNLSNLLSSEDKV